MKKKTKRSSKLPVEVDEDEFIRLLQVTNKLHHKVGFLLAWQSGLRVSEVIDLKPEHIDLKHRMVFVKEGKGCKDRYTKLPIDWMPHLIDWLPHGKCSVRALQAAFYTYAEKAKITEKKPTVHFHSLRHGFATHMVRKGVKLHHVQALLGHNDLSTTSVYIRCSPNEAVDEADAKW